MKSHSLYSEAIREITAKLGYIGQYDPRHIEAYMRLVHSTLDGLTHKQFVEEVKVSIECIDIEGESVAESLAVSYNL